MTQETFYRLAPPLIALQFLSIGWTVNREINVADADRQIVIPLPDVINIVSLFATVGCLVVIPIATESYFWLSRMVLGCAYVLLAFHPFTVAAHYRLWNRKGRAMKAANGACPPYINREELITSALAIVIAIVVATYLRKH